MKIILTGATGFTGREVLKQALADPSIEQVTILSRRPTGVRNAKLNEVILENFLDYSKVAHQLKADACIWCLGISQTEVNEAQYIQITFDYTMEAAKTMFAQSPDMRFCFLSGRSANQEEKSKVLYGRIKGRTERELSKLSSNVFNFRPGFIRPLHFSQEKRLIPKLFTPLSWLIDLFSENFSVDVTTLAKGLIHIAKNGSNQKIFDNAEIRKLT